MSLRDLLLPGLLLAGALALGGILASSGKPAATQAPAGTLRIWSLTAAGGERCGAPLVPRCTSDWGAQVLDNVPGELVWGWTPPGDMRAANQYGKRLIADVEYRPYVPAAPQAAWAGTEVTQAEQLADVVSGVTSHGFVPAKLKDVLMKFASRGLVGYPQVYDSDQSAEPREFLRNCLHSWRAAGFTTIRPLLGVSAGLTHLAAWYDECRIQGVTPHLWSLQRIQTSKYDCNQIGLGSQHV